MLAIVLIQGWAHIVDSVVSLPGSKMRFSIDCGSCSLEVPSKNAVTERGRNHSASRGKHAL